MTDQPIGVRLPKEMLKKIEELGKNQSEDRSTTIRKLVIEGYKQQTKDRALQSYIQGKITLTEAAYQAGLTLWEFEQYLIQQGYKSDYSLEDMEKELNILVKE